MSDLFLHALSLDATPEKSAQGFLGLKESKYYDPKASIEDVEKGTSRISSTPSNWIGEISDETSESLAEFKNLIGEDFPELTKALMDQIIELLNKNHIRRKTVRGTSSQLVAFLEQNLGHKICLYAW